jgi:hypothetical protein
VTDLDADAGGADPRDHYEALGVALTAPPEVIRAAYLALAKRYHPDGVSPDAERIRRINEAWRVLGRPSSRAEYDKELARAGRSESDDDAGGFSFGSAGWGEQDDGTTTLVEEVHDPAASGSPGWGDDFDGPARPWGDDVDDEPRPREGSTNAAAGDREQAAPGHRRHLGLLLWSLTAAGGMTWFGARYLHGGWALAVLAIIVAGAWLGWRGRESWAFAVLAGAWICALIPVRIEYLLRQRGGDDIGAWLGWCVIVLLWLGGVALVTMTVFSSFAAQTDHPDDQTDAG